MKEVDENPVELMKVLDINKQITNIDLEIEGLMKQKNKLINKKKELKVYD